jgi:hypothetical protein
MLILVIQVVIQVRLNIIEIFERIKKVIAFTKIYLARLQNKKRV